MLRRVLLIVVMLWSGATYAAEITDSAGRIVQVPDHVARVLPAGPPAAVLLAALAPDLMIGWPMPLADAARPLLAPGAANLPQIPRVTGHEDVSAAIKPLKPDLIVDYGTISARYADLAQATQERTGVPTILLDGSLVKSSDMIRRLGALLHREQRAETLARFAEALLSLPPPANHPRVLYARGAAGLLAAAPDSDLTEVFRLLGWQVVAPDGNGTFRPTTIDKIRKIDPDVLVFSEPAVRETLAHDDAWKAVRAVSEGHVIIAPSLPFGWIENPPSINRLLGLAWLEGSDPETLAALANAIVYGHVLTPAEHRAVLAPLQP
ncbi:ABC transporter substrate-binding protein [Rhodopila globiformis]|nr:ABC transporter substrate-binding protein [Rhodopila globiformis]